MSRYWYLAGLGLVLMVLGCVGQSAAGFHLPEGDSERGRTVFVELGCAACHTMEGLDLPAPVAQPAVGVELATVLRKRTTGELVTSIIAPSHKFSPSWTGGTTKVGDSSRMADYTDVLTIRQLSDLVAFLRQHQEVKEPPTGY